MDRKRRLLLSVRWSLYSASVVAVFRLIKWYFDGSLLPVSSWRYGETPHQIGFSFSPFWDVPVAALVTFMVLWILFDPRTWSWDDDVTWFRLWLHSMYVAWLGYGAMFGLGCAVTNGLTVGMAMGLTGSFVLISAVHIVVRVVRGIEGVITLLLARKT